MKKIIDEGEILPRGYGVAYIRWDCRRVVCYPVPINWIVSWTVRAWAFLRHAARPTLAQKIQRQGWTEGYAAGCERAESEGRMQYDKGRVDGWNAAFKHMNDEVTEHFRRKHDAA